MYSLSYKNICVWNILSNMSHNLSSVMEMGFRNQRFANVRESNGTQARKTENLSLSLYYAYRPCVHTIRCAIWSSEQGSLKPLGNVFITRQRIVGVLWQLVPRFWGGDSVITARIPAISITVYCCFDDLPSTVLHTIFHSSFFLRFLYVHAPVLIVLFLMW